MARVVWVVLAVVVRSVFGGEGLQEKWNPFLAEPVKGFFNLSLSPNPGYPHGGFMLHLGAVDLKQDAGTPVYAVRKGIPSWPKLREGISKLETWTTTIQIRSDDGILTYFMHLDPNSIPKTLLADIEAKRPVEAGTLLGTLYKHDVLASHVHFGAADCRKHLRINPQPFVDYVDTQEPVISALTVHNTEDRKDLGATVSGDIQLTLNAHDKIDGQTNLFPLHRVDLEITFGKAKLFSSSVFDSSSLPARPTAADDDTCEYLSDYDGYNITLGNSLYRWRAKGDSDQPIALTANKENIPEELKGWFQPFPGPWQTTKFPNGAYTIKVKTFDAKGNHKDIQRSIKIAN